MYRLVIIAGKCSVKEGEAAATVDMKATDAIELVTGKLNPMVAFMTGKIKAKGDIRSLMILQSARTGKA